MKPFILLFVTSVLSISFCSCSPYEKDLKQLEAAYAGGQLSPEQYYLIKGQYLALDQQWRQNFAASMQAASSQINQNYYNQQMVNAYNQRTNVMARPQQVWMNGTMNHNVNVTNNPFGY